MADYTLNWSDNTLKSPFTLPGNTVDSASTSLTLTGKGAPNWGEPLQENLIHLLENFASAGTPPAHPTAGQLWYDNTATQFKFYNGSAWLPLTPPPAAQGVYPRELVVNSTYGADNRTIIAELGGSSATVTVATGALPSGLTLSVGQVYAGRYVVYASGTPTTVGNYQGTLNVNGEKKLWFNIDVTSTGGNNGGGGNPNYTAVTRTIVRGVSYSVADPSALIVFSDQATSSVALYSGTLPAGTTPVASSTASFPGAIFVNGTPAAAGGYSGVVTINGADNIGFTVNVIEPSFSSYTPSFGPFTGSVDLYRTQVLQSDYAAQIDEAVQLQNGSYYTFTSVASGAGLPPVLDGYVNYLNNIVGQLRVFNNRTERWNDAGTSVIATTGAGLDAVKAAGGSIVTLFEDNNAVVYAGYTFKYKLSASYNAATLAYTFYQGYNVTGNAAPPYAYTNPVPTNSVTIYGVLQYMMQNGVYSTGGSTPPAWTQVSFG